MTATDLRWRVSVATMDRVVFQRPQDGTLMLALERKGTLMTDPGKSSVYVRAQPFGGAVQILNSAVLRDLIGDLIFDSKSSEEEQDFRLLIRPTDWEPVKQFCLQHLQTLDDPVLESDPSRELVEEFDECLHVNLRPDQYTYQSVGFVVENDPRPSDNIYSRGLPTVRIYRIFEVQIVDEALCVALMTASDRHSDTDLHAVVRNSERGRANTVLTLPLDRVLNTYLNIAPEKRYAPGFVDDHQLDVSVLAVLDGIQVPQFVRS